MTPSSSPAPGKKAALSEIQNKENHGTNDKHVSFKDSKLSSSPSPSTGDKGKSTSDKPETISPFKPLQSKPIEIPSAPSTTQTSKSQSKPNDVL